MSLAERLVRRRDIAYLLEHRSAAVNLFDNVLVEDGLSQDGERLVLVRNAKLLRLEIDVNVVDLGDAALLFGGLLDPITELRIDIGSFAILVLFDNESTFEVFGKFLGTSFDSLFRGVDGPFDLLGILDLIDLLGFSIDTASKLVVAASLKFTIAVFFRVVAVAVVGTGAITGSILGLSLLFSLALGLLGSLVLLSLLWLVLKNERAELQTKVNFRALTASFAVKKDASIFDVYVGLGVLALLAKNELLDEAIKMVLKFGGIMGAVDDPTVISRIRVGLCSELETEKLDDICISKSAMPDRQVFCVMTYRKEDEPGSGTRWSS